jgi:hypothetical protein
MCLFVCNSFKPQVPKDIFSIRLQKLFRRENQVLSGRSLEIILGTEIIILHKGFTTSLGEMPWLLID